MRGIGLITILLLAALVLSACGGAGGNQPAQPASQPAQVTKIDVEQLATMLENKDFTLVNVHIPYAGDIPNTDLSIPFNEIAANLDKLPDKEAKIVVYCRSGSMSNQASQELARLGYTNVYDVVGGMKAWTASGRQLVMNQ